VKVGDMVKIVQSPAAMLKTPFTGQVGVIVKKTLMKPRIGDVEDDWYDVFTRGNVRTFRTDYLERIK
jgi:hypothetical protein